MSDAPRMTELFSLAGKVALVTGASRGIGRAIAELMASAGARVVVSSRKLDACEAVVASIREAGNEAMAVACNVSRREDIESLVDTVESAWGGIDVVCPNAGIPHRTKPLVELPTEDFDRMFAVNTRSVYFAAKTCVPYMGEGGAIVSTASIGGRRVSPST